MNILESVKLAIDSIRVNKLRTFLTLLSIAIGVFAIIGAGSLVASINSTVEGEIEALGETTFYIFKEPKIQMGNSWRKYARRKPITYSQYQQLKNQLSLVSLASAVSVSSGQTVKFGNSETNPDVNLIGVDEDYFILENRNFSEGRNIVKSDIIANRNVAVIGNDVKVKLFPNISPIGKMITIKNQKYEIIGVLEPKGAMFGQSQDNMVLIPITHLLNYFASFWESSVQIVLRARSRDVFTQAIDEAIGVMRLVRNLKPWEENDFEIETNESIKEQFSGLTKYLQWFGFISGGIALIAAGVGIMNIMLVSVKERTREIGVRKAVGAKRRWIMYQFIIEAITLCQVGGAIGIVVGVIAGGAFGLLIGGTFSIPVGWVVFSVIICTMLGVIFGAYPAWKAAKLDPIEALRYE
ncbi:MAG TPA: ABC transporter permease [Candidatus Kapabacteria bacterium]|jgi:putative ABC transport system permease protein|nr:ABC transporter permease [Candidatus Kapabacteria bacterium]HOM05680.1 ABC transporter permease [Candidatus Kapabacteria bacterium]